MVGGVEHVRSWYAATAQQAPERGPLTGDHETEICIVGGGFSGVAAALTLAERGRSVTLLESHRIGWGATGRNGGQVLPGWSGEGEMIRQLGARAEEFLRRTKYRGAEIIEDWIARYAIDCDYIRGAATVAVNNKQMQALTAEFDDAKAHDEAQSLDLLDREALRRHVATDAYCGGLVDRRGAHCHPLNLCLGEARAAEELGVRIFEGSAAREIAHGDAPVVHTSGGKVRAKAVILAGSAYHRLEQSKLSGYMLPAQTFMIATEPLGVRAREVLPDNLAICDANWVLDYFRRSADDRILFGGRCTYSNREIIDIEDSLLPRLKRILPQFSDAKVEFAWGGAIGIPLNRVPLIGEVGRSVFYVQGYSGHGVNCSHVAAEILADAIDARREGVDFFEAVRHVRIPAAGVVGNPMLALGMSWFRMRDALGI